MSAEIIKLFPEPGEERRFKGNAPEDEATLRDKLHAKLIGLNALRLMHAGHLEMPAKPWTRGGIDKYRKIVTNEDYEIVPDLISPTVANLVRDDLAKWGVDADVTTGQEKWKGDRMDANAWIRINKPSENSTTDKLDSSPELRKTV